jgi:hypothetical protein
MITWIIANLALLSDDRRVIISWLVKRLWSSMFFHGSWGILFDRYTDLAILFMMLTFFLHHTCFINDCSCIFLDDISNYYFLVCFTLDQRRNSWFLDYLIFEWNSLIVKSFDSNMYHLKYKSNFVRWCCLFLLHLH